jgi:RimJ/RimL family protein N-acetyltransferase
MTGIPAARIAFRPLRRTDLVRMRRWLNAGEALRWYGKGRPTTAAEVAANYLPKVRGDVPTRGYLVLVGERPVGYAQTYRVADWPEYAARVAAAGRGARGEDAAGLDLFLGEPAFLHRGLGPEIVRRFLEEVVWPTTGCRACVVGPHPENRSAVRAFEKAGFRAVGRLGDASDPDAERLMRRTAGAAARQRQSGSR